MPFAYTNNDIQIRSSEESMPTSRGVPWGGHRGDKKSLLIIWTFSLKWVALIMKPVALGLLSGVAAEGLKPARISEILRKNRL